MVVMSNLLPVVGEEPAFSGLASGYGVDQGVVIPEGHRFAVVVYGCAPLLRALEPINPSNATGR